MHGSREAGWMADKPSLGMKTGGVILFWTLIAPCRATQHRRAGNNDAYQIGLPPRAGLGQNVFHMRARGCFRNVCVTGELLHRFAT